MNLSMDFNDIKNTWKNSFKDEQLLGKKEIEAKLKINSNSNIALNKVKRNYLFELILSGLLSIFVIIWLYLNVHSSGKYFIILITFLFFGALFSFALYNYRKVKNIVISTDQLKLALKDTIRNIERYVNFNKSNFTKFILLPFAILFGMFLGLQMGSEETGFIETLSSLSNSSLIKMLIVFVVGSIIMIPISQYLNKKMYKRHLDELKQCLKEFESIEEENL